MAKVTGPLFSLDARNKLGNAIVYSYWKGRNYVRRLVTPSNPQSDGQAVARTYLGSIGKNNSMIEVASVLRNQIVAVTPKDQSWSSYFGGVQAGPKGANCAAALAAYALLSSPSKAFWVTAAATIPLTGFDVGYGVIDPITGAEQLFVSAYAGFLIGLAIVAADPSDMTEAQINAFAAAYAA
jgi:hypothetical protein